MTLSCTAVRSFPSLHSASPVLCLTLTTASVRPSSHSLSPSNRPPKRNARVAASWHDVLVYDLGLSFFSLYRASRDTLATLTILKRTPANGEGTVRRYSSDVCNRGQTKATSYLRVGTDYQCSIITVQLGVKMKILWQYFDARCKKTRYKSWAHHLILSFLNSSSHLLALKSERNIKGSHDNQLVVWLQ